MGKRHSRTVAITQVEGGDWIPFKRLKYVHPHNLVHAIKFRDGSIWDVTNGWRSGEDIAKEKEPDSESNT